MEAKELIAWAKTTVRKNLMPKTDIQQAAMNCAIYVCAMVNEDDDELITTEWLLSIGAEENWTDNDQEFKIPIGQSVSPGVICLYAYSEFLGWNCALETHGGFIKLGDQWTTHKQVRKLLAALGGA